MENAADALKIGAWVLIFVTALTIAMSAFSQARQSIDAQLTYADREYLTKYIPNPEDVEGKNATQRIVGIESIVPTISRAFQENFEVVFIFKDTNYYLYRDNDVNQNFSKIDLEANKITEADREKFLQQILYGKTEDNDNNNNNNFVLHCQQTYRIQFNTLQQPLYNYIINSNRKFEEKLGVYYQDEREGGNNNPKENKSERRVVTYREI